MNLQLDTIIIFVQDTEKLKSFYHNVLQLVIEEEIPGEWVLLRAGIARIGLHKMGNGYPGKNTENVTANNNTKIVFETTADIHGLREQLLVQGVPVLPVTTFDGYDYWICDGKDPEGNVFQIKQKKMTEIDINGYFELFQQSAADLDTQMLKQKNLELAVGRYQDAIFLKLYKKEWANDFPDHLTAESRIFFSVWVTPKSVVENKLWYNIHALKLRKLKGYRIESRRFATAFRSRFTKKQQRWPNLRTDFGPLTLMEGWTLFNDENFLSSVTGLANLFLPLVPLIDETLGLFKSKA
jgi:predicted enzyme related to lactoylglutathione lyase